MKSSNYLKNIGFIRTLSCILILLYHMNILKGGYLLVCTFFVLNGYLLCISCFKKEKFSFEKYYLNKLLHLYLPLIIVVFISIFVISLIPSINWFNLKPEVTSVLLGYNNFWQLDANLDYFARHVSSPFMHLWYMGIILQFDLVFPFIYLLLRKIGDKNKIIPCIITFILALISTIYFYKSSLGENIMFSYYNTFSRLYSLLFGVFLGFINYYYEDKIFIFKGKYISKIVFYLYILVLILFSIFIKSTSNYYAIFMIITTIISCRLISYDPFDDKLSIIDKIIKFISNISYEIYLVQYPIIFIFQQVDINNILKIILIILLTFIISFILKFSLNIKNNNFKILRIITLFPIVIICIFGSYKYIISKDYTNEMKELEQTLKENAKLMEERKKEYAEKLKKEQENWMETLSNLENTENELKNVVANLSVVGIGDSVMLGAINNLQKQFPNGYFDAAVSRTAWVATDIVNNLSHSGLLGEPIIINLGANGDCDDACKARLMNAIGNRKVFWLNVTNSKSINRRLENFAKKYNNIYIIDWNSISKGHPEYFVADGIHLTQVGKEVFSKVIYDSIYNVYLEEYNLKKQEIIKEYEEKQNKKISFIGNSMLINAYEELQKDFSSSEIIIDSEYKFDSIKKDLETRINNNTLSKKVIFAFDSDSNLNIYDYQQLIDLCKNYKVYIVSLDKDLIKLNSESATIIDFYSKLKENNNYLMPDKIHLTKEANKVLNELIKEYLK